MKTTNEMIAEYMLAKVQEMRGSKHFARITVTFRDEHGFKVPGLDSKGSIRVNIAFKPCDRVPMPIVDFFQSRLGCLEIGELTGAYHLNQQIPAEALDFHGVTNYAPYIKVPFEREGDVVHVRDTPYSYTRIGIKKLFGLLRTKEIVFAAYGDGFELVRGNPKNAYHLDRPLEWHHRDYYSAYQS